MKSFFTSKVSMFVYGSAVGGFLMFAAFSASLSAAFEYTLSNGMKYLCIRTE